MLWSTAIQVLGISCLSDLPPFPYTWNSLANSPLTRSTVLYPFLMRISAMSLPEMKMIGW